MDNNEYRIRMEQLLKSLEEEKYPVAAKLADSLDWRRVSNIKNLNTIAKAYRMVKDYEQELEVLKLAYDYSTTGRAILENLIKCAINLEDLNLSIRYYNEYLRLFPSANTYYLKFLLYRLQGASRQELIAILKEHYNGADEQAMFDLAVLYYREGMINQCISTCDDIIMFCHPCNESYKAMELKMKFMPLNEVQMEKYRQKHKNVEVPMPKSKEVALFEEETVDDIVIPEYSELEDDTDKLQEDLSLSVQSLLGNEEQQSLLQKRPVAGHSSIMEDMDIQIPGQMSLEDILVDLKNKKQEAVNMINSYQSVTAPDKKKSSYDANPYLSPEALMTAKTKELSVERIVNNPEIQKPKHIPPIALGQTQSLNLMKDIIQDLSYLKGGEEEEEFPIQNETLEKSVAKEELEELDELEDFKQAEEFDEIREEEFFEEALEQLRESRKFKESIAEEDEEDVSDIEQAEEDAFSEEDMEQEQTDEEEPAPEDDSDDEEVPDYYQPSVNMEYQGIEQLKQNKKEEYPLSDSHKKTLGYFANIPDFARSLSKAISHISSGKKYIAVSSVSQDNRVSLSKKLIEASSRDLGNTNVKLAVSKGDSLNEKDISEVFEKIKGGFLIIDKAADLTVPTVEKIYGNLLLHPDIGLVVCDVEHDLKSFFELNPDLEALINVKVRLPILTNDELTHFGEEYAGKKGYLLDEMAKLAIYDTIGKLRQNEKMVTVDEIKEIIDQAIKKKENKAFRFFGRHKGGENILQEKDLLMKS